MLDLDTLWSWLIRTAVFSSLLLGAGAFVLRWVRQPAEQLRLIQLVLACCLIAPCLPISNSWRTVSLDLTGARDDASASGHAATAPPQREQRESHPGDDSPAGLSRSAPVVDSDLAANVTSEPTLAARANRSLVGDTGQRITLRGAIVLAWALGAACLMLRILAGLGLRTSLQRRAVAAAPATREIFNEIAGSAGHRVRMIVSDEIHSPMTWGTFRPVIAVPRRFETELSETELRWGLAHEWSHVRQRDDAALWLAVAVQIVCFYQPLYWLLRRRMTLCQDYIADAFASRQSDVTEDYASFLVRLAQSRPSPADCVVLGIADRPSRLRDRITALLAMRGDILPGCRRRVAALACSGALLSLVLSTTIRLDAGQETGVVQGRLTDAMDGSPVPNATVMLRGGQRVTVKSDDHGEFRFENVVEYPSGYTLWAHRENLVTGIVQVSTLSAADGTGPRFKPLQLSMKPGKQARFLVTSRETGQPVAGASVRFGYPDRRHVTTDDHGMATVEGLLPQIYDVTVEGGGHARNAPQVDLSQADEVTEFAITLVAGGEVRGVVLDEQGQPVPEAEIVYREGDSSGYHGDSFRTNERGEFVHRFLPLSVPLEVSAGKEGYLSTRQDVSLASDQRVREVRVTLARRPPGVSVAGVVQDRSGKPVVAARIENYGNGSSDGRTTTTDDQGRFNLDDLLQANSEPEIFVTAKGFAPHRLSVQPGPAGAPTEMNVRLEPGHTLRGRVVNEAGLPVIGAYVMARSGVFRMGMESVQTDDQGDFHWDSLPDDVHFELSHPDYASTETTAYPLDTDEPVTMMLSEPGQLLGRIIDAETMQPIRQFHVRIASSSNRQPGDVRGTYASAWREPGLTFQSEDGRFAVRPLKAGMTFEVTIESEGYERQIVARVVAANAADSEALEVALVRRPAEEPASVAVRLLNHLGRPIPDATLRLIVSTNQPAGSGDRAFNWVLIRGGQLGKKSYVEQFLSGVTDADGRFTFTDVAPGRYLQLAYWGTGFPAGRTLSFDETRAGESQSLDIEILQPASVRGTIDRSKFPDAGSVTISDQSGSSPEFSAELKDGQETFELADLPVGRFDVTLVAKPVRYTENGQVFYRQSGLSSQTIDLAPGDLKEIRFDKSVSPQK